MKVKWLLAASAAALIMFHMSSGAQAFGCPQSLAAAQELIDKVKGDMEGDMSKKMAKADMAQVHMLLDDAKMLLAGAKHNHEKPQGRLDHARAIAKADSALGYARAADILHFALMKQ